MLEAEVVHYGVFGVGWGVRFGGVGEGEREVGRGGGGVDGAGVGGVGRGVVGPSPSVDFGYRPSAAEEAHAFLPRD